MAVESLIEVEQGIPATHDIVPIFLCEERPEPDVPRIVSFRGTGFRVARDLLVTCWHCVAEDREGHAYAIALPLELGGDLESSGYRMHSLIDVSQDLSGTDLATARIHNVAAERRLGLSLATRAVPAGADVWTWGYPLTEEHRLTSGEVRFVLNPRCLKGYVTRPFLYEHPGFGQVSSYEVDMPAPEGLSGSPLVLDQPRHVIGVIYGTREVARIEEAVRVDPETGERRPEVERIVSFGLAHYTSSLVNLAGSATGGMPLGTYLSDGAT